MKVVIDGMGGDNAPKEVVAGAVDAIKEFDVEIIITGKKECIEEELKKYSYDKSKIEIVDAREVIETNETPVMALRRKKDSSLVKALNLVKENKADAIISAGSTGALMAGASLILGRIKGIDRVALAPIMPGKNGTFMIIDSGANVDCKPHYLVQFGIMGKVYYENVLNFKNPTVGLINIGVEEEKGNELTKEAYGLLKNADINFIGNVEPRESVNGDVKVLVCDGFVGNTILKTYEGVASSIFKMLKEEMLSSFKRKIGALLLKDVFLGFKKKFDYAEYGGSPFLGCKGICLKAHGSSDKKAFKNAVKAAILCYEGDIVNKIKAGVEILKEEE